MEILRFGPGHRRLGGPPGTQNVEGAVIMGDERAIVSELAFGRYAMVAPHENPDSMSLFIVVSGAGWVQVGDERTRINHGEAVVWPARELHGAYTDGTEMRAIVVELTDRPPAVIEGTAHSTIGAGTHAPLEADSSEPTPAHSAPRGSLAERKVTRDEYDSSEGEPW